MIATTEQSAPGDSGTHAAFLNQLRTIFEAMPEPIPIYMFVQKGQDNVFAQANRQIIRAFTEITDKIRFREFDTDHDLARQYGVTHSPSLVIAPDKYRLKWLGAPMGEETRTFLELLLLVGQGQHNLADGALGVIQQIDSAREVKVFVSATCPYCPQEAINGVKAVIANPAHVGLEIIDIQCFPEMAEQYAAQGVPQAYANDLLIGQGAQTEELFALSLQKLAVQNVFIPDITAEVIENDLVIVGGGPAGLAAAIYAERAGLKTFVVEKNTLGGQVATTPIVENYPGFAQVGGKALVDILVNHALQYAKILQGEEVLEINSGDRLEVVTNRRRFIPRAVLLATGASHRKLGIPGEDNFSGRGVSYCATCDGPLFKGRRVMMVGGGNTAVTEALYLHNMGVDVTLVHRRDSLRAQEFLIKNLEENKIPVLWNSRIEEIHGKERVEAVTVVNTEDQSAQTLPVDGVFVAIGYEPAVGLAQKAGIELDDEGYIKHDRHHRTNIPGVYSAGDVEGGYKQIVTATAQGSEAAMSIFEDLINPYWLKHA